MSAEDTEVPQLQEHAKKLTVAGRMSSCRRFLNDLNGLLNSMTFWATNDGTRSILTDNEKRKEESHLRKLLKDLEKVSGHHSVGQSDTATTLSTSAVL